MECRTVLGPALAAVVEAGGGNVGVPEPFLDLGDDLIWRGDGSHEKTRKRLCL